MVAFLRFRASNRLRRWPLVPVDKRRRCINQQMIPVEARDVPCFLVASLLLLEMDARAHPLLAEVGLYYDA